MKANKYALLAIACLIILTVLSGCEISEETTTTLEPLLPLAQAALSSNGPNDLEASERALESETFIISEPSQLETTETSVQETTKVTTSASTLVKPTTEPSSTTAVQPTTAETTAKPTESTTKQTISNLNAAIQIVSLTSPILPGSVAEMVIKGAPNTEYDINVIYKSGESSASGLENKTSDESGYVSWTWKVGPKTTPGKWRITVKGGDNTVTTEFVVQ